MKITLLALILGVLIVFLLEVNYLTDDIKTTVKQSVIYPDRECKPDSLNKYNNEQPAYIEPNSPKHKIWLHDYLIVISWQKEEHGIKKRDFLAGLCGGAFLVRIDGFDFTTISQIFAVAIIVLVSTSLWEWIKKGISGNTDRKIILKRFQRYTENLVLQENKLGVGEFFNLPWPVENKFKKAYTFVFKQSGDCWV